ncbi:MAG: hypothetical protein ABFS45_21495 [Pseudomonadota bacterium]
MKTFKSIADVEHFCDHPIHDTVKELVLTITTEHPEYRPEEDGYLVLLEPSHQSSVQPSFTYPVLLYSYRDNPDCFYPDGE